MVTTYGPSYNNEGHHIATETVRLLSAIELYFYSQYTKSMQIHPLDTNHAHYQGMAGFMPVSMPL